MDLLIELICTVGKTEQGGGGEEKENSALRLHSQVTLFDIQYFDQNSIFNIHYSPLCLHSQVAIFGAKINCRKSTIISPKSYFQVDCVPLQRKAAQRHDQETPQGVQGGAGETQKQSRRKCTTNFFSDVT